MSAADNYFVRSGLRDNDFGSFRAIGGYGRMWTRTTVGYIEGAWGFSAYNVEFTPSEVISHGNPFARWYGFPVRCLVY